METPRIPASMFTQKLLSQFPDWFGLTPNQIQGLSDKEIGVLALFGNLNHVNASIPDLAEQIVAIPDEMLPSWLRWGDHAKCQPGYIDITLERKQQVVLASQLNVPVTIVSALSDFDSIYDITEVHLPEDGLEIIHALDNMRQTSPSIKFATDMVAIDYLIKYVPSYVSESMIVYRLHPGVEYKKLLSCENMILISWINWLIQTNPRNFKYKEICALLDIKNPHMIPPDLELVESLADLPINKIVEILSMSSI